MSNKDWNQFELETQAVRAGHHRTAYGEHGEPIFMTSSFVFDSAEHAAARFSGEDEGCVYSRFSNPTVSVFQERLAMMEGGEACVATASGMSAILSTCLALLEQGDEILASKSIFGSITVLFDKYLSRSGLVTKHIELTDLNAWQTAITPKTKMLFVETPSNPMMEVVDIRALADIAHRHDCLLVVDNCFCTPVLQRPLELGADIVVHSATKFLDGQGRALGGAVVGSQKLVGEEIMGFLRTAGPTMSAFNAWVFMKGLETLKIRMDAHCRSALQLATWLEQQEQVERVYYPGLKSHPQHELAKTQQDGFGGIVTFVLKGGQPAAWLLINNTKLLSITANLGDVKTTITHPATTTHCRLSPEQRAKVGIENGLVRIAVGLESIEDIKADLRF